MIVYKLPDDYFERYVANIQAVTRERCAEGGRHLHSAPASSPWSSSATAR